MTARLAELISLVVCGGIVFGACVYLLVSYLAMARHVEPRPGFHHAAAMLRELFYVIITQPLVPIYYFKGRVMGP